MENKTRRSARGPAAFFLASLYLVGMYGNLLTNRSDNRIARDQLRHIEDRDQRKVWEDFERETYRNMTGLNILNPFSAMSNPDKKPFRYSPIDWGDLFSSGSR